MGPVDIVLFDLGGVLLDLGGVESMRRLAGIDSDDEIWRRWLTCEWVRRFESGRCGADDFAAGVVAEWELGVTPGEFLTEFRTWPRGPYAGAVDLIVAVGRSVRVGCLSNTNAVHWAEHFERWNLSELFEAVFLSHEVGHVKPEREIFEHVLRSLDLPPEQIVFLDDNAVNIDQARDLGIAAHHVRGVEEARSQLGRLGVLPG